MNELEQLVDEITKEAEDAGVDLSAEELAELAWEKLSQDAGAEEVGEELTEEEAEAIVEDAASEAVEQVADQAPADADPEDIAEAAAEMVPEIVEEKTSAYLMAKEAKGAGRLRRAGQAVSKYWKRSPRLRKGLRYGGTAAGGAAAALGGAAALRKLREKKGGLLDVMKTAAQESAVEKVAKGAGRIRRAGQAVSKYWKRSPRLRKGLRYGGVAAGGAAAGAGGAEALRRYREKKGSDENAELETAIVKRARELLTIHGFNPDTGEAISKIGLAKTAEEAVDVGALELLESQGWPVRWSPEFLSRAVEE